MTRLPFVVLAAILLAPVVPVPESPEATALQQPDTDNDGLLDIWETSGAGPIRPSVHGCNPRRADLFLVVALRPGVTRAQVQPTLDSAKAFFARVPIRNPDGSTGINMIAVWGNTIPASDANTPYTSLYEKGMPREWRGFGHGVLIGADTGGGGQTAPNSGDWSGISNNFPTLVHELGHQLGLKHYPLGFREVSPIYTSLMNYDYNYAFNGDAASIHFSQGKFASLKLRETSLNETVPFPAGDLEFLTRDPYFFEIQGAGPRLTRVDWNRNRSFGERGIRADINDGYSVVLKNTITVGQTAGSPALAPFRGNLAIIYPELLSPAAYATWSGAGLSTATRGRVSARLWTGSGLSETITLVPNGVSGDPDAVEAFGKLIVAYPVGESYTVTAYDHPMVGGRPEISRLRRSAMVVDLEARTDGPALVRTALAETLWVFYRDKASGQVRYRKVEMNPAGTRLTLGPTHVLRAGPTPSAPVVTSQGPVAAVWNSKLERIGLVATEERAKAQGRLVVHQLGRVGPGNWYSQTSRLTMGDTGWSRTRVRPAIVHDPAPARGPYGAYFLYHKGDSASNDEPKQTWAVREIANKAVFDGWRLRQMGNEWTLSISAPAAALYRGEIAYAYRWNGEGSPNALHFYSQASGISGDVLTDHDDVTFIRARGLKESLAKAR